MKTVSNLFMEALLWIIYVPGFRLYAIMYYTGRSLGFGGKAMRESFEKIKNVLTTCYFCTFFPRSIGFDYIDTWKRCVSDTVDDIARRAEERNVISGHEFDSMVAADFADASKENIRMARRRYFGG